MKKKQMKASLLLASLLTLGFSVTGCTNDDYDFDQIDATMGFGSGELEIPASSTMNIPLSDILELEEGGSVKIAANGDYLFQLTGSDASSASPMISPIVLRGNSYSNTLTLNANSAAKGTRAAGSHLSFVSPKELMFKYNGTNAAVRSLKSAEVAGEIELKINLTLGGLSSAINKINRLPSLFLAICRFHLSMVMAMAFLWSTARRLPWRMFQQAAIFNSPSKLKNWISQIRMLMVRLSSAIMALSRWMVISTSVLRLM